MLADGALLPLLDAIHLGEDGDVSCRLQDDSNAFFKKKNVALFCL